ncbi:MAG TPA: PLP-dependent aminotransferase family protein [Dehalococcoidia bacterium]|nr:PLP-dependent aminotransferase family protein [Dehalococcoidia bacterium]
MNSNLPSLLIATQPKVIDLGWGHPSARLHPLDNIRRASTRMLSKGDTRPLQYGATQGYGPFLESLATFLSKQQSYQMQVDPHNLFLTAGASQGLDLACTLFASKDDTIVVEEPTYFVIEQIFREHNLKIAGIPTDSDGMMVSVLAEKLESGFRPKLVYTIPTYQNPTGTSMPPERRKQLVALATEFDFHILADEVYQLIHFERMPPPPLISFDHDNRVLSFGSFSKILAPGLRVGWIQASRDVIRRFTNAAVTFSGGGFNHYGAALVKEFIDMGFLDTNVTYLRQVYSKRASVMNEALQANFGNSIEYEIPTGGYYFWLRFIDGLDTEVFLPLAEENGVSYRPGKIFSESGRFNENLRLTYTLYETDELEKGIARLGTTFRNY